MRFNPISSVTLMAVLILVGLAGLSLRAQETSPAERYQDCMVSIGVNAEKAFDAAVEWRDLGGGDAAEHCVAAALLALGYYEDAAGRLEELAQRPTDQIELRTGLLRQAAQGWSLAEKPERAFAALTAAIQVDEKNPKLYLERAVIQADMGLYGRAVDDLSRCLVLDPVSVDAYAFRASAYRYLDQLDLAAADLNHALEMMPAHLEARLERGIVRRLQGDDVGARLDWTLVLDISPDSPTAESARRNLELLDVKVE